MKSSMRIGLVVLALAFVTLACGTLPSPTPTQDMTDSVATQVAATLTAVAGESSVPPSDSTTASPPEPGETVVATLPPPPAVLRVAYIKNKNVWLWTEGLGSVQLTASANVQNLVISDDGQVVAFVREPSFFNPEIWAINTDGSGERMLASSADLRATYTGNPGDAPGGIGIYQMVWRPGSHILYYSTRPLHEGPGYMGYYDLHSVHAESLAKVTLFNPGDGGAAYFSPDGLQIALSQPTSISLVNADGSNLRRDVLTYGNVITYSEYLYHPSPVWAPDSSGLRVVVPPADPLASPLPPSTLWYIPTNGSPAVFSGNLLAIPFAWPDTAIAPDLSRVGYAKPVGDPTANNRELHLALPDGSSDTIYASGELEFIGWLPNSTQFVFEVRSGGSMVGTHVGTVGGGYTTLSTDPTLMTDITWPDETHFLYRWRSGSNWELRYNLLGGAGSTLIDSGEIWTYDFSK